MTTVRDEQEWERIAEYIEEYPVKAGVAATAEEYPWSKAVPSAPAYCRRGGQSARATLRRWIGLL